MIPYSFIYRIHGKILLLPVYHTVSDCRIPHIVNVFAYRNIKQFETDLDFLQKYYCPVSLLDLVETLRGNALLPEKSFLLTFDDGYREIAEVVAPILIKRSIPAVFFLNSAFIDNRKMFYRNFTVNKCQNQ